MEEKSDAKIKLCRNCGHPMSEEDRYCTQCGQKHTTGKVSFGHLLSEFFEEVFSLDSRIFLTAGALFRPGKLTNEYFAGRHKRYAHPIRLFFLTAVLFFGLLSIVVRQSEEANGGLSNIDNELYEKAYRSKFMDDLDVASDSVRQKLSARRNVDLTLDTLLQFLRDSKKTDSEIGYLHIGDDWSIQDSSIQVDYQDIIALPRDSFFRKYQVEGLLNQTMLRQTIRLQTSSEEFMYYLLGQMIWMVLLMMPFLALILKLLYIRRRRYYIEHLVFSFHYHAFGFVAFMPPLLITILPVEQTASYEALLATAYTIAGLALAIYLFVSMRRIYRQGVFKTFVKFSMLNFTYMFIFIVMITLAFGASALMF